MDTALIAMLAISAALAALGLAIVAGRADGLIAGYNTATDAERKRVNVRRLRLVVAGMCWLCALLLPLNALGLWGTLGATAGIFAGGIACLTLANTWAKR